MTSPASPASPAFPDWGSLPGLPPSPTVSPAPSPLPQENYRVKKKPKLPRLIDPRLDFLITPVALDRFPKVNGPRAILDEEAPINLSLQCRAFQQEHCFPYISKDPNIVAEATKRGLAHYQQHGLAPILSDRAKEILKQAGMEASDFKTDNHPPVAPGKRPSPSVFYDYRNDLLLISHKSYGPVWIDPHTKCMYRRCTQWLDVPKESDDETLERCEYYITEKDSEGRDFYPLQWHDRERRRFDPKLGLFFDPDDSNKSEGFDVHRLPWVKEDPLVADGMIAIAYKPKAPSNAPWGSTRGQVARKIAYFLHPPAYLVQSVVGLMIKSVAPKENSLAERKENFNKSAERYGSDHLFAPSRSTLSHLHDPVSVAEQADCGRAVLRIKKKLDEIKKENPLFDNTFNHAWKIFEEEVAGFPDYLWSDYFNNYLDSKKFDIQNPNFRCQALDRDHNYDKNSKFLSQLGPIMDALDKDCSKMAPVIYLHSVSQAQTAEIATAFMEGDKKTLQENYPGLSLPGGYRRTRSGSAAYFVFEQSKMVLLCPQTDPSKAICIRYTNPRTRGDLIVNIDRHIEAFARLYDQAGELSEKEIKKLLKQALEEVHSSANNTPLSELTRKYNQTLPLGFNQFEEHEIEEMEKLYDEMQQGLNKLHAHMASTRLSKSQKEKLRADLINQVKRCKKALDDQIQFVLEPKTTLRVIEFYEDSNLNLDKKEITAKIKAFEKARDAIKKEKEDLDRQLDKIDQFSEALTFSNPLHAFGSLKIDPLSHSLSLFTEHSPVKFDTKHAAHIFDLGKYFDTDIEPLFDKTYDGKDDKNKLGEWVTITPATERLSDFFPRRDEPPVAATS